MACRARARRRSRSGLRSRRRARRADRRSATAKVHRPGPPEHRAQAPAAQHGWIVKPDWRPLAARRPVARPEADPPAHRGGDRQGPRPPRQRSRRRRPDSRGRRRRRLRRLAHVAPARRRAGDPRLVAPESFTGGSMDQRSRPSAASSTQRASVLPGLIVGPPAAQIPADGPDVELRSSSWSIPAGPPLADG